ncbi:MAG: hypothetical protein F4X56_08655 [Gammaproteobacteria bacterium]|nr:hypothetical protein [Gammaproteobacteria bacterium]
MIKKFFRNCRPKRAPTQTMQLVDTQTAWTRLRSALEMEETKFNAVKTELYDLSPDYWLAKYWGFMVPSYLLLEQAMKVLIKELAPKKYEKVQRSHRFSVLSRAYDSSNLDEFYQDIIHTEHFEGFPKSYIEFFKKLDSDPRKIKYVKGVGNAWRYFLIQYNIQELPVPTLGGDKKIEGTHHVRILHELAKGCLYEIDGKLVRSKEHDAHTDPIYCTFAHRQFWDACEKLKKWIFDKCNSPTFEQEKKITIFKGPDWKNRYYYVWYENGTFLRSDDSVYDNWVEQFGALPDRDIQHEHVNLDDL